MKIINGIQQIGIGVKNVQEAFTWYRKNFHMDVRIFEEAATAGLMLPYTGGVPQKRHAILAINLQGGGGFEIWQYTGRTPQEAATKPMLGDLGIFITKMKCRNAIEAYQYLKNKGVETLGNVITDALGQSFFYVKDLYGNIFQYVESSEWFTKYDHPLGGVFGCIIGVSDLEAALPVYRDILAHDQVLYDETRVFSDFQSLPGGNSSFRRVLLSHSEKRTGAFSPVLGSSQIELVQVSGREPLFMYKDRFWGDPGFIHLCWDIHGMAECREECQSKGFPFTVDSSESFDMGEAAGHFSYIADKDGTLIEFVETHKVPIIKKLGWYIHLTKRDPRKPLPRFILKAMGLNRVKD